MLVTIIAFSDNGVDILAPTVCSGTRYCVGVNCEKKLGLPVTQAFIEKCFVLGILRLAIQHRMQR